MIYGYIRVSTDKQTLENQVFEIKNYCQNKELKIDEWIKETISGTKDFEKRKLGHLLKKIKKDDILISSEISRLGRNLMQIMSILNICMTKQVQVITIKDNFHLKADIQTKVLAFAFGLAAEIERNLISQRTREALQRIKYEGKKLGRPKGRMPQIHKLDIHKEIIKEMLAKDISKTKIAKRLKVSRTTLLKFISDTF